MGRRTTGTTKGGRYMNPADQERKNARKKELKKNKKQRHVVRQAVLKSKDPSELVEQMAKIDEMEFSTFDKTQLSERVMQEKRNKLRETFVRVMGMYRREGENEKFTDLKKLLQNYDQNREKLLQQYTAVKFAREVSPAEIPLPDAAPPAPESGAAMTPAAAMASRFLNNPHGVPFPPHLLMPDFSFGPNFANFPSAMGNKFAPNNEPLHGILKRPRKRSTVPPGPPVGPPVDLSDSSEEEDEDLPRHYGQREKMNSGNYNMDEADEFFESISAGHRKGDEDHEYDEQDEEGDDYYGLEAEDFDEYDEEGNAKHVSTSQRSARVRFEGTDLEEKDSRTKYKELAKKIERGEIVEEHGKRVSDEEYAQRPYGNVPPPNMGPGGMNSQRMLRPPFPMGGMPQQMGPGGMRVPRPPPPEAKISVPGGSVQHAPQKSSDEAYETFMKEVQGLL